MRTVNIKKIVAFILVLSFLFCYSAFSVSAVDEICNGNPHHHMISRGWGSLYDANMNMILYFKPCWQCHDCLRVVITAYDPIPYNETHTQMFSGILGWYDWDEQIPIYGTSMSTNTYYEFDGCLQEYEFWYNDSGQ